MQSPIPGAPSLRREAALRHDAPAIMCPPRGHDCAAAGLLRNARRMEGGAIAGERDPG